MPSEADITIATEAIARCRMSLGSKNEGRAAHLRGARFSPINLRLRALLLTFLISPEHPICRAAVGFAFVDGQQGGI